MHKIWGAFLIASLGVMLLQAPVLAAPPGSLSAPLGTVLAADNAHAGVDATYSGSTIYDGDRLVTQDIGTMRVRLGTGQMFLHQNTSALVHSIPNGFSADLDAGIVSISSAEGQTFQLLADGATIRPASTHPTSAQIAKISPTEVILTPTRGALQSLWAMKSRPWRLVAATRWKWNPKLRIRKRGLPLLRLEIISS